MRAEPKIVMPVVMPASCANADVELGVDRLDALRVGELGLDDGRLRAEQLLVDGARHAGIGGRVIERWHRGEANGPPRRCAIVARCAVACAG